MTIKPKQYLGHPGNGEYHYHFHAYGTEYDGCLMSCNGNVESGIVGVAYDGFPFYGPMQYYSGELLMSHMI